MIETINMALLERSMTADGWAALPPPAWLAESWRDRARFVAELCACHDAHGAAPLKSPPLGPYDLFHDLVLRNVALDSPALIWHEAGARRELSFPDLALSAGRRAAAWRQAGAHAGQTVALLRGFGPEWVVSLLATLKLGLVFALVPPGQRRLARARLAALAPDFVDLDPLHAALVPEGAERLPSQPGRADGLEAERSHLYQPGEPVALLFDPASAALTEPRPLSGEALFAAAVVDGPIVLGLRRGDALAAPGLPLLSTQPALACAALMSGAGFVHLTLDELEDAPERLVERPLRAVGVGAALRDLMLRHAAQLGPLGPLCWASWFRDPLESPPLEPWQELIAAAKLNATPAMNLRWEPALGGCALFSPRRIGRAHCEVWPAPGRAWSLVDLARDDVPAAGPGRLALSGAAGPPAATCAIVMPYAHGWLCGGALPSRPSGRAYPSADAVAIASAVDGCRAATLLIDPTGPLPRAILVLFCGGDGDDESVRQAAEQALAAELGLELMPDDIVCFPLYPRADRAGAPDARWCHRQLRDGELAKKSADELYRLLSRLRERVVPHVKENP